MLQDNYFHAVFEATKGVADKIRDKAGLLTDGATLVDEAFSVKHPLLALNRLITEAEKMEQIGFATLLKGIFVLFRNTTAHAPKIKWSNDEQDALDLLTMVSYAHRKLDTAISTGFAPMPQEIICGTADGPSPVMSAGPYASGNRESLARGKASSFPCNGRRDSSLPPEGGRLALDTPRPGLRTLRISRLNSQLLIG